MRNRIGADGELYCEDIILIRLGLLHLALFHGVALIAGGVDGDLLTIIGLYDHSFAFML